MTGTRYPCVVTVAGSDSSGGAGIQADLKTFSALRCYGASVLTALTAQNTCGVFGVYPISSSFVGAQMDAVFADLAIDAVKTGMLHSADVIQMVAERLARVRPDHLVVDPVMVAKSGDRLLQDDAVEALTRLLIPLATVITPNRDEAERLLGQAIRTRADQAGAAIALLDAGAFAVLVKGGHVEEAGSADCLAVRGRSEPLWFEAPRVSTLNTHGTGCTFASAIAAYLARGHELPSAVASAKEYISAALAAGAQMRLGAGHGPVHHFHSLWSSGPAS